MKKKFEMPAVEIRSFECENIATTGSNPDPTNKPANQKAREAFGTSVQGIFDLDVNVTL